VYDSVEIALKSAGRPMQPLEVFRIVNKSEVSCWRELKGLRKRGQILKVEQRISIYPNELCNSIILYKWIGHTQTGEQEE